MARAVRFIDYTIAMFVLAMKDFSQFQQVERDAIDVIDHIKEERPETLNETKLARTIGFSGLRNGERRRAVFEELETHGWLRRVESARGRGRPRGDWIVNPKALEI
jgi:hypothetical protein